MAENPVSRTWVQQVFLPLVPGVDSLLEPLQEQAEDAQVPESSVRCIVYNPQDRFLHTNSKAES